MIYITENMIGYGMLGSPLNPEPKSAQKTIIKGNTKSTTSTIFLVVLLLIMVEVSLMTVVVTTKVMWEAVTPVLINQLYSSVI